MRKQRDAEMKVKKMGEERNAGRKGFRIKQIEGYYGTIEGYSND